MSILGKWFKKDTKKRLETQTEVPADVDVEKVEEAKKDDVKPGPVKAAAKTTKKDDDKKTEKKDDKKPVTLMSPVLLQPHISEKSTDEQARGIYTFVVASNASKSEIQKAITRTYQVKPKKVRVINMRGKSVRWGRSHGKRNNWRKAMVYLKKGDSMVIHEGT